MWIQPRYPGVLFGSGGSGVHTGLCHLCIALEHITFDSGSKLNQGFFVTDDALGVVYDALVAARSEKGKVVPSSTNADRWRKTDVHLQHFRVTPVYMVRQKHAIMQYWDTKETHETIMRLEQRREIDPRAQRARALYHFADCNKVWDALALAEYGLRGWT